MKAKIRKCACGNYTLERKCAVCGKQTRSAIPLKYSPQDKYGKYRRKEMYGKTSDKDSQKSKTQ